MEPDRQIEIQLGHMCNNRCVFCVSGQRTGLGEAGPMPTGPILEKISGARALGHRKITLLGGEPTLQPGFLDIVRHTVALGFEEIVLFTNGARTARAAFIDQIRETGGHFTWRISLQGATEESHERTTKKPGSFDRIVRTLTHLRERGERATVNMCVVGSNYEDVAAFPGLLLPFGVRQLHLDMMRPLDAGVRTEEELRAMLPRYDALAGPFRAMIEGFPPDFDVNLGNLPFCVAPDLTPWIHHDGEPTETIAIDGDDRLSRPWNKYLVKRRDKLKPSTCEGCLLNDRCSGVFETYAKFHGLAELVPIDAAGLARVDPGGRSVGLWAPPLLQDLMGAGFEVGSRGDALVSIRLEGFEIQLRSAEATEGALGVYERFTVHPVRGALPPALLAPLKEALLGLSPSIAPIGEDLIAPSKPRLARALARLRSRAPFGELVLETVSSTGERVEITLRSGDSAAVVWLGLSEEGQPRGGYRVLGEPTELLKSGLKEALLSVRVPGRSADRPSA